MVPNMDWWGLSWAYFCQPLCFGLVWPKPSQLVGMGSICSTMVSPMLWYPHWPTGMSKLLELATKKKCNHREDADHTHHHMRHNLTNFLLKHNHICVNVGIRIWTLMGWVIHPHGHTSTTPRGGSQNWQIFGFVCFKHEHGDFVEILKKKVSSSSLDVVFVTPKKSQFWVNVLKKREGINLSMFICGKINLSQITCRV